MPAPDLVDPVNASLLGTAAAQTLDQANKGFAFVSEQSRLSHLRSDREVGVREAQAMQEVRQSAQAREILQARAAADQPSKT